MTRLLAALALALTVLTGSAAQAAEPTVQPLPVGAVVDYQLGGSYRPADQVTVVVRDRTTKAAGRYSICYVNSFQTQPGTLSWWKKHHPRLLLKKGSKLVHDPGWPDEVLMDLRTADRRRELQRINRRWFAGCARDGYEAVEADNLDSWTRSSKLMTKAQAKDMARRLAVEAHAAGLALGQKNTPELDGKALGLDFAVAEECQVYRECGAYTKLYGAKVVEIEYTDNGKAAYQAACTARGGQHSILLRDRDVVPRGSQGYVFKHC